MSETTQRQWLRRPAFAWRVVSKRHVWLLLLACAAARAQPQPVQATLGPVTVSGQGPVQKSYRRMVAGMDMFERMRRLAPAATLRLKLLPRRPGTNMDDIDVEVVGNSFSSPVSVSTDRTFTLERDPRALAEDAVVMPNRRRLTMTWRTEIRTPGLPAGIRRLGDLRLECLVGLEAGLVSSSNPLIDRISEAFTTPAGYCGAKDARYLFFSDKPLFGVTLVHDARREVLPVGMLYAGAADDPGLKQDLPFCDCQMLLDRTYFLPLGDRSWPDDTQVRFEFMEDGP